MYMIHHNVSEEHYFSAKKFSLGKSSLFLILYCFASHIKAKKMTRFAVSAITAYQNSQLMISLPQIERFCLNNSTISNVGIEQIKLKVYCTPIITPFIAVADPGGEHRGPVPPPPSSEPPIQQKWLVGLAKHQRFIVFSSCSFIKIHQTQPISSKLCRNRAFYSQKVAQNSAIAAIRRRGLATLGRGQKFCARMLCAPPSWNPGSAPA